MPAKSVKQKRLMQAVANNPEFAKEVGIPQSVGKEYIGKARGGSMKLCSACKSPAKCKAAGMCLAKKTAKAAMGGAMKYKEGGKLPMVEKAGKMVPAFAADGKGKMAKGGKMKAYKKGGSIDGCAMKGKTRGRMV